MVAAIERPSHGTGTGSTNNRFLAGSQEMETVPFCLACPGNVKGLVSKL
jgi:hypothetical protein